MSWSFDADVHIYAAAPGHEFGEPVWKLLEEHPDQVFGSNLLLPEVLTEPVRMRTDEEDDALLEVLARLTLIEVDDSVAMLSVERALPDPLGVFGD